VARVSIIGPTSIVIGDVTGRGDLEIIGRVQGDVVLEGTVTVAPDGVVLGSIRAQGVRVAGRVDGSVVAKESLSLQAGANVSGDLVAARLGIEEGARVRGTVRTEGGDLEEDDDEDEVIADQSDDVDATPSEAPGGHERRRRDRRRRRAHGGGGGGGASPHAVPPPPALPTAPSVPSTNVAPSSAASSSASTDSIGARSPQTNPSGRVGPPAPVVPALTKGVRGRRRPSSGQD